MNQTETEGPESMQAICHGNEGVLLTENNRLYLVWPAHKGDGTWTGMQIFDVQVGFTALHGLCGAEVDMRQDDNDAMTPEIAELGDRVAAVLRDYFDKMEREATAKWKMRPVLKEAAK